MKRVKMFRSPKQFRFCVGNRVLVGIGHTEFSKKQRNRIHQALEKAVSAGKALERAEYAERANGPV